MGEAALIILASDGHLSIVEMLMRAGADLNMLNWVGVFSIDSLFCLIAFMVVFVKL